MRDFSRSKRRPMKQKERKGFRGKMPGIRSLLVISFFLLAGAGVVFGIRLYRESNKIFPIGEVVFYGNTHLSDNELRAIAGINGESILHLSTKAVSERLLKSPWIRSISVRKDMPRRMSIKIQEASPF